MNAPSTRRRRDMKARPRFDSLEGRQLMAASFGFDAATGILSITSTTNTVELVKITDDGTGGNGNVRVESRASTSRSSPVDSFTPGGEVKAIVVDLGPGNDSVTYFASDGIAAGESRDLSIATGAGRDKVSLNLGRLASSSNPTPTALGDRASLVANVNLGDGDDTFDGVLKAKLTSESNLKVNVRGSTGNDDIRFRTLTSQDVASTAVLDVALNGDDGRDNVTADYVGKLDGTIFLNIKGGAGNDTASGRNVSARVRFQPNSTGKVGTLDRRARVDGGTGDDRLSFRVQPFTAGSPSSVLVAADVDGGTGTDTAQRTANVTPLNIDSDAVFS